LSWVKYLKKEKIKEHEKKNSQGRGLGEMASKKRRVFQTAIKGGGKNFSKNPGLLSVKSSYKGKK